MSAARRFAPGTIDGPHRAARRATVRRWVVGALALWTCAIVVGFLVGWLS